MGYQTLKAQLKSGALAPFFHFYGPEHYLKSHYVGLLKAALVDSAMETFNYTVLTGSVSAERIVTAVQTPPMMAEKKLIVLKDTGIFTPSANGKEQLAALFSDFPSYAHLVAVEEKADRRSAVYKAFAQNGLSVEFAYRSRNDLRAWVLNLLRQRGKTMTAPVLDAFLDAAGVDMHGVLGHLEKLCAFAGTNPSISKEAVDSLLVRSIFTKEYMLTDALLSKNEKAAMAALSDLWELNTDPMRILTVIASNFMSVLHARALLEDKVPFPAICDALHLPSAFLAKKTVEAASKTDINRLDRAISAIREADYKLKTGLVEPKTGITLLCATLLK